MSQIDAATQIVDAILTELAGRKGLGIDSCDEDIQEEICDKLILLTIEILKTNMRLS